MSSISQLLVSIDDASWEALGSKGLFRRATKEVEKGIAIEILSETPFLLKVRVSDWTVTVPSEGPAKAKCTCGAQGCCHHVIAAGLFFRRQSSTSSTAATGDELGAQLPETPIDTATVIKSLTDLEFSIIKRWCGAASWRTAIQLVSSGITIDVRDENGAVHIHLNPINVGCRYLAGTGLDGAIVSGGDSKSKKSFVVAAVIALKAKYGESLPADETLEVALGEEKGAPRSRAEVLATARTILEMAIAAGLTHAGVSSAERFSTLAVSANGTNLPRLAHELKTVAEELSMIATRQGRADAERTLDVMAHAYALVAALTKGGLHPSAQLVGQHRTGYFDVRTLQLFCVSGFPWRARSGFRGITLLFWDVSEKRWASWTEARSVSSDPRYNPLTAFDEDGPWESNVSIRNLPSHPVQLTNARRNSFGRLSSTKACTAAVQGLAHLNEIDFGKCAFSSWQDLVRYAASTSASGLKQSDPMSDWVVLTPARWGDRQFDRVEQRLSWIVFDDEGRSLTLALMYSEMTQHGVEALEGFVAPSRNEHRVLGRILRNVGECAIEPVALLPVAGSNAKPIHLLIPPVATNRAANSIPRTLSAEAPDDDELEVSEDEDVESRSTNRSLQQVREHLVRLAESGSNEAGRQSTEQHELLAKKLGDAGLPILSNALAGFERGGFNFAEGLLKAAYLLRLHEQCRV